MVASLFDLSAVGYDNSNKIREIEKMSPVIVSLLQLKPIETDKPVRDLSGLLN